jgi:RNA polymerase sigma-70 factor (ECF subfamily)
MPPSQLLDVQPITTPAETAMALKLVSEVDLLRLKTIARVHARGLPPDVGWADLLQEAFARVLNGTRRQPEGLSVVMFLAGVMRSLKSEHWRRAIRESRYGQTFRDEQSAVDDAQDTQFSNSAPGPERSLSALQELAAIDRLFVDDPIALQIIAGLAEGDSAEQIRDGADIAKIDYASARKRIRRALLREGLTCRLK